MFTGLINCLGTVVSLTQDIETCRLTIRSDKVLPDLKLGESVAVNGACLTAAVLLNRGFSADVMPETLRCSNLAELRAGDRVNLERTLRPVDGLDGHVVTGHVEGIGTLLSKTEDRNAWVCRISATPQLLRYIVPKGSIAVDGISLTVTTVTESDFGVSLIPTTAAVTTLGFKNAGARVNLETDILAKYVEKMLGCQAGRTQATDPGKSNPELTQEFLARNGF